MLTKLIARQARRQAAAIDSLARAVRARAGVVAPVLPPVLDGLRAVSQTDVSERLIYPSLKPCVPSGALQRSECRRWPTESPELESPSPVGLLGALGGQMADLGGSVKALEPTLSRHLLAEAGKFALYPQRVRKAKDAGAILDNLLAGLVASSEWVVEKHFDALRDLRPEERQRLFDEHYSKALLEKIRGMAVRTDAVPVLRRTRDSICRSANLYLREATRSYILGLWDAAVALSRAALEEALKDRVRRLLGPVSGLDELIKAAERKRLVHRDAVSAAKRLQRLGNIVLHERQGTEDEALASVRDIRVVLQHLYDLAS